MLECLEITVGPALVVPAAHPAMGTWRLGTPVCGDEPCVAMRGSIFALAISWDAGGSMRFEWMGAANAPEAPERKAWELRVIANGVTVWHSENATDPTMPASFGSALGNEPHVTKGPLSVDIHWSKRIDGRCVEIIVADKSRAVPLRICLAPLG
jgi:hypothetical protein